ncbi:hypothetical protein, partial [Alteromonas sp. CyTr2]|uniref:hypothetical protein n=1 Tax=Alteromonas sp. CyTr2 TaxID=2935039 RepID=UPI00248DDA8F
SAQRRYRATSTMALYEALGGIARRLPYCCSFQFLLTGNGTRHSSVNLPLSYSNLSGCIDQLVSGSVKV